MRRILVIAFVLLLVVWGLLAPPGGGDRGPFGRDEEGWDEGLLRLELVSSRGGAVTGARVLLGAPGGRQLEGTSDERGRVALPLFLLDDFLFHLVVEHPGHERLDWRLRGADLARGRRRRVLLLARGSRVALAGRLRPRERAAGPILLEHRIGRDDAAQRPAPLLGELRLGPEAEGVFRFEGLPPGSAYELRARVAVADPGIAGLAGTTVAGRLGETDLDLGEIELAARTLTGRVLDPEGAPAADCEIMIRLSGWGETAIRTRSDRLGRYRILVPAGEESLVGRAALGRGAARRVEIPWSAEGPRAADLVLADETALSGDRRAGRPRKP